MSILTSEENLGNKDVDIVLGIQSGIYNTKALLRKKDPSDTGYRWEYDGEDVPFLRRCLEWPDVLTYGLSSSFGAGIYVVAGTVAAENAGSAVTLSILIAGLACMVTAFCYSEFSERIHVSGSAYTYAYVAFGELLGWLVGCILTVEYVVSAAAVAQGVTGGWNGAFAIMEMHMPEHLLQLTPGPVVKLFPLASILCLVCASAILLGVKDSARFYKVMTFFNVATMVFIFIAGIQFIDHNNWVKNWAPNGFQGIMIGASKVFFAYIGFDTCTVLAGEVKNPSKQMAKGVIGNLSVSIVLYTVSALVLTGMIAPADLKGHTEYPFVYAFAIYHHAKWAGIIVVIGSLLCMMATIFCCVLGQPRILYQMAKDGLLHKKFSDLNKRKIPIFGSVVTVIVATVLAFFFDLSDLGDMISCGTLVIFTTINLGIISLRHIDAKENMRFKHFFLYGLMLGSCVLLGFALKFYQKDKWYLPLGAGLAFIACVGALYMVRPKMVDRARYKGKFLCPLVPLFPCIGCLFNIVMIIQLGWLPMVILLGWALVGLVGYFVYGIKNSRLNFIQVTDEFYY